MSKNGAALIMDLKKSRSYSTQIRYDIQTHLIKALSLLNQIFKNELYRKMEFSAGDEIQGLFKTVESAYLYCRILSMWLHPIRIRSGIGVGSWDIEINDRGTTSQDGVAYHNARYAIDNSLESDDCTILIYSMQPSDLTINTIINLSATIGTDLSVTQNQLSLLLEFMFPIYYRSNLQLAAIDNSLISLFHEKSQFDKKIEDTSKSLPFEKFDTSKIALFDPAFSPQINLSLLLQQQTLYITSGKQRGMATELAKILKISRQSISASLKNAGIYTARNLAITALYEMDKMPIPEKKK